MNRSDSTGSASRVVAANFAEDTFDALFNRFRKEVLLKVTRNDLTSNNDILRSIFNKLVDVITAYRTEYKKSQVEKGLNLVEFKMGIRIVFQNVIPAFKLEECSALFVYFDSNKDGRIGPEDFVVGIKGKLNMYRSSLIDFVFQLLDRNCDGVIDEKDMVAYLLKTGTPGILQGKMLSPKKKSQELIRRIGKRGEDKPTGIFLKDLQDFYIDRGLFVVDDVMFKFDVLDDWLLSDELATIYLRNVAPDFNAAGALCRGENNEMVQQSVLQIIKRERTISHGMDLEELANKPEETLVKQSSQSAPAPAPAAAPAAAAAAASPPPTAKPTSTKEPSPRQAVHVAAATAATTSSEKSASALALEQQQKALQQQMEMMKVMQQKQQELTNSQKQHEQASSPSNSNANSAKNPNANNPTTTTAKDKGSSISFASASVSNEKLNELVATVRMLTRQLEEQNHVMKKQEAKLTDFEKTVTEQAEVIQSQQAMISTQQSIISTLQQT